MFRALTLTVALSLCAACGDEIGDSCSVSSDCSPRGDRICDINSPGGYCTVIGCDIDTCPEESVCVRFFATIDTELGCDPATEDRTTDDCTVDEVCALSGRCALRTAEVRYCMRNCIADDDCRKDYECRGLEQMRERGGEPVPGEGDMRGEDVDNFCAAAPI